MKKIAVGGLLLILSLFSSSLWAQRMNIGFVYPAGGAQGTTFEIEIGGQYLNNLQAVLISGKGVSATILEQPQKKQRGKGRKKTGEQDNVQIAERVKVRVVIDKDAPVGIRDLRLKTATTLSNRLFFEVSQPQEVVSSNGEGANDSFETAMPVESLPSVLNGQCLPGQTDYFRFTAKKGQALVCDVKGRLLVPYLADAVPGWFQPVMALYDASNRQEVAYSDDHYFRVDPLIVFHVPHDGEYVLSIRDAIYRGREDFLYRIQVGELPYIESVFPLGGTRGKKTSVELTGVNLSKDQMTVKEKSESERISLSVKGKGGLVSNQVPFELSEMRERFEPKKRSSSEKEGAVLLTDGEVMNGKIALPGELDWYCFDVERKGQKRIELLARRLGSPLDGKITIFSESGEQVAMVDDTEDASEGMETHHADPVMIFSPPKQGRYYIRLEDVQRQGGANYGYRLKFSANEPDFELRIDPPNISLPQGGSALVKVTAIRKNGFNGEIQLRFPNLPKGYQVSYSKINTGSSMQRLTITSPEEAFLGPLPVEIQGVAESADGATIRKEAVPAEELMQAFYLKHLVPASDFNVTVTEQLPFTVSRVGDQRPIMLNKDTTTAIRIAIHRREGFVDPINFVLSTPMRGLKMKPVVAEADQQEVVLQIECHPMAKRPIRTVLVVAAMGKIDKIQGKTLGNAKEKLSASMMNYVPAIEVVVPPAVGPVEKAKAKSKNKK